MKTPIDDTDNDIYYFHVDAYDDDHFGIYETLLKRTKFVRGKKNLCKRLIEEYFKKALLDERTFDSYNADKSDNLKELSKYFVINPEGNDIEHIKPEFEEDLDALAIYDEIFRQCGCIDGCGSYDWGKVVIENE